jgi:hypothetical protein
MVLELETESKIQMSMSTSPPEAPARKLRWFQYSLRSLLLFTLLVSVGMSWVAVRMGKARRQKEAVEEIRKLGGVVLYVHELQTSGNPLPSKGPPGPAWLRSWLGDDFFTTVVDVEFPSSSVTDAGLTHLKGLTQLWTLDLDDTNVTDEGVKRLQRELPQRMIRR